MNDPSIEQWRALLLFRQRHGRTWKSALSLHWMNGTDENEPLGAALRMMRNQFGPSWLHALRPKAFAQAEQRIALLDRLPVMCATYHGETGDPIILKRAESGYWRMPGDMTVEQFNAAFLPTPGQIAAMEAGSVFGWDMPAADPGNYDAAGRLKCKS